MPVNRKWTKQEDDFLKENYQILKASELSKKLKRSKSAIYVRAHTLKIPKLPQWSYSEKIYLEENYLKGTPISEISKHLNRSKTSCVFQANVMLGITRAGEKDEL